MCGKINKGPGAAADGDPRERGRRNSLWEVEEKRPAFSKTAHLPDMYHVSAAAPKEGGGKEGRKKGREDRAQKPPRRACGRCVSARRGYPSTVKC